MNFLHLVNATANLLGVVRKLPLNGSLQKCVLISWWKRRVCCSITVPNYHKLLSECSNFSRISRECLLFVSGSGRNWLNMCGFLISFCPAVSPLPCWSCWMCCWWPHDLCFHISQRILCAADWHSPMLNLYELSGAKFISLDKSY